jgi:hypothetical protein
MIVAASYGFHCLFERPFMHSARFPVKVAIEAAGA